MEKPPELVDILDKFLREKFIASPRSPGAAGLLDLPDDEASAHLAEQVLGKIRAPLAVVTE
jgi:hypothetical protein